MAIAAGAVIVAAIVFYLHPPRSTFPLPPSAPAAPVVDLADATEKSAAATFARQKQAADRLALSGQLQPAYDAYSALLQGIAAHNSRDPLILTLAAGARSEQDQVFAALLRKRTAAAPPAPTQPAAPGPALAAAAPAAPSPATPPPATSPAVASATPVEPPTNAPVEPLTNAPVEPSTTNPQEPLTVARPPVQLRTYYAPTAVTDEQIGLAIHRGVMFLQRAFRNGELHSNDDGLVTDPQKWPGVRTDVGVDCLCVYALLHAGQANGEKWLAVDAPFTKRMLQQLKSYNLEMTYHRSLRAAGLAVYARTEDRAALEADVAWLIRASRDGAYTYGMPAPPGMISIGGGIGGPVIGSWDNSNSQYGLLGVWAGAQAGVSVPDGYWTAVERHWNNCQLPDGQWGYVPNTGGYLSMTDAGAASLLVTRDYLDHPTGRPTYMFDSAPIHDVGSPALLRGLDWLDQGDNSVPPAFGQWAGYVLYGVERVGLASGYKYFGIHDWYAEQAKRLVQTQHGDGAWGDMPPTIETAIDTAYSLLFLSRGRHPILYNKLRFNGYWDNRRHDVQNLADFATHELERPINWQIVNLMHDWPDWMDSPVLYLDTDEPPKLSDTDLNNLRDFALGGGLLFTHADGGATAVNEWVPKLAKRLFPEFPLQEVPGTDPLFSVLYPMRPAPRMWGVSNGSRWLMVHSPSDLAGAWELKWAQAGKLAYQMGLNVFLYAAGKGNLRNRVESPYIPAWDGVLQHTISVQRLRYDGNWDPEPYAWTRLDRYMSWETQVGLGVSTVDLSDLAPGSVPIADLTGGGPHQFSDAEVAAVRAYVGAGGVLLIDACGGRSSFADDVRKSLLAKAFPGTALVPLPPMHPVLQADRPGADDLSTLKRRPYAMEQVGPDVGLEMLSFGKGEVIFSPLDLTTGLLGTNTWGIIGYEPAYAAALVKNAVLWADARAPAPAPATQVTTEPAP